MSSLQSVSDLLPYRVKSQIWDQRVRNARDVITFHRNHFSRNRYRNKNIEKNHRSRQTNLCHPLHHHHHHSSFPFAVAIFVIISIVTVHLSSRYSAQVDEFYLIVLQNGKSKHIKNCFAKEVFLKATLLSG